MNTPLVTVHHDIPRLRIEDAPPAPVSAAVVVEMYTPRRTYPAGWIMLALVAAVLFTWLPVLVFAAIGFLILGVLKVLGVRRG
ncbi:MAG: hypothetical protein ABWY20_02400 [Mycobacterium sp.]